MAESSGSCPQGLFPVPSRQAILPLTMPTRSGCGAVLICAFYVKPLNAATSQSLLDFRSAPAENTEGKVGGFQLSSRLNHPKTSESWFHSKRKARCHIGSGGRNQYSIRAAPSGHVPLVPLLKRAVFPTPRTKANTWGVPPSSEQSYACGASHSSTFGGCHGDG